MTSLDTSCQKDPSPENPNNKKDEPTRREGEGESGSRDVPKSSEGIYGGGLELTCRFRSGKEKRDIKT